jgi:hypothetical protein
MMVAVQHASHTVINQKRKVDVQTQDLPAPLITNSKVKSMDVLKQACLMTAAELASHSYGKLSRDNSNANHQIIVIKYHKKAAQHHFNAMTM